MAPWVLPYGDTALEWLSGQADAVVLAWGSPHKTRCARAVRSRALAVREILARSHSRALTPGFTRDGSPRHPLFVPGRTAWRPVALAAADSPEGQS